MGKKSTALTGGAGLAGGVAGLALGSLAPTTVLGAFAGPIGLGVGVAAAFWIKGQAHWKANTFIKESQGPLKDRVAAIVDPLGRKREAGTLTYEDVIQGQKDLENEINSFEDARGLFSSKGGDQAKVVEGSRRTLDPIMAAWRKTFADDVLKLKPPNPEDGVDEKNPPTTGPTAGLAKGAAEQREKRAKGAQGRPSTILAGSTGTIGTKDDKKTLLGGGL